MNKLNTSSKKEIDLMITLLPLTLIVGLSILFFFYPEQSNTILSQIRSVSYTHLFLGHAGQLEQRFYFIEEWIPLGPAIRFFTFRNTPGLVILSDRMPVYAVDPLKLAEIRFYIHIFHYF